MPMFDETHYITKLLTVAELNWSAKRGVASPRNFSALSLRLSGRARFIYGEKRIFAAKGDILFMPEGLGYTLDALEDEHLICVHFKTDVLKEPEVFTPVTSGIFNSSFRALYEIWTKKDAGYEYAALSVVGRILENIALQSRQRLLNSHTARGRIEPVIRYIGANLSDENLSVSSLAAMCSVSETYFRKLFCDATGKSPQEYISACRLSLARELLSSGYYTVGEAAVKCGIPNTKYFSTFVRKQTSYPPSALKPRI